MRGLQSVGEAGEAGQAIGGHRVDDVELGAELGLQAVIEELQELGALGVGAELGEQDRGVLVGALDLGELGDGLGDLFLRATGLAVGQDDDEVLLRALAGHLERGLQGLVQGRAAARDLGEDGVDFGHGADLGRLDAIAAEGDQVDAIVVDLQRSSGQAGGDLVGGVPAADAAVVAAGHAAGTVDAQGDVVLGKDGLQDGGLVGRQGGRCGCCVHENPRLCLPKAPGRLGRELQ